MTKLEQVAQAICKADGIAWEVLTVTGIEKYTEKAKAAIVAMREPTTMMSLSGNEVLNSATETRSPDADDVFRAMIDQVLAEDGK